MNSFQFYIFDILITTQPSCVFSLHQLWIPFNFISLTYWLQPGFCLANCSPCCEFLSILYLWHIDYNLRTKPLNDVWVVNSFQFYIFDILITTSSSLCFRSFSCEFLSILYLWHIDYNLPVCYHVEGYVVNSFQFYIFDILITTWQIFTNSTKCCEFLSILYLWHIDYNCWCSLLASASVVNSFQFYIFDILITTEKL